MEKYLLVQNAWLNHHRQGTPSSETLQKEAERSGRKFLDVLQDYQCKIVAENPHHHVLDKNAVFMIGSILRDVSFQEGKASKDGKIVVFESLHDGMRLGTALSSLIKFLGAFGCELSYEFDER